MKNFIKHHKVWIIVLLIALAIYAIYFPIQRLFAIYAVNGYLMEKGVSSEEIYKVRVHHDTKGGFSLCVEFVKEPGYTYKYWCGYNYRNWIHLNGVYENSEKEDILVGDNVRKRLEDGDKYWYKYEITPMYEPDYVKDIQDLHMEYTFLNFARDIFTKRLLFEPINLYYYPWDFISLW